MRALLSGLICLALTACGTPTAVRQLSDEQTRALDQLETLVRADNQSTIARLEADRRMRVRALENQQEEAVNEAIEELEAGRAEDLDGTIRGLVAEQQSLAETVANIEAGHNAAVRRLESRIAYIEALQAAQEQIDRSIDRNTPMERFMRRVLGDENYENAENILTDLQAVRRRNSTLNGGE